LRQLKNASELRSTASVDKIHNQAAWRKGADYVAGKPITPKYVQPNADIVAKPPPFPWQAKILIGVGAAVLLAWLISYLMRRK
jgi:hypothetical protein